jgi:hypothetical protein
VFESLSLLSGQQIVSRVVVQFFKSLCHGIV